MKDRIRFSATLLPVVALAACLAVCTKGPVKAATKPQQSAANMTAQPASAESDNQYGPSFAYLAWELFLEAMTPSNGSLTFETWTEQCQLNPNMVGCPSAARIAAAAKAGSDGKVRLLHGTAGAPPSRNIAGSDCSAMIKTPLEGYPAPSNLTPNAMFCEEVYVSPAEASFIKRSLTTLVAQQTYGDARNGAINFPGTEQNESRIELDSFEVKVDWVPVTSFHPTFACPDPTHHLYTETINGTCYAMAAVHITSKVMPNWLWATFEPNSNITNPNRCDPKLYGACLDPYGTTSSQPYGKGHTERQSPELSEAMASAHLNPSFSNYFLTGVQTQFVDSYGKPIQLGNSFVEFNQGVPPGKSSCITCHQYAAFDGKHPPQGSPENNFGKPPHGWPSIGYACNQNQNGNCIPAVPHSTMQDFSWILGLMPYTDADSNPSTDKSQSTAKVRWDGHRLEVEASNSSLNQILREVATRTGAKFEGLNPNQLVDQRVFGTYGPGPALDVLSRLLDGSGYNLLMVASRNSDTQLEIILSTRLPAVPQAAANNQNRSHSYAEQAAQRDPEPPPDYPLEAAHSQPAQNPYTNGGPPPADPAKFMQEILQRQQVIDQQQQQHDQQ